MIKRDHNKWIPYGRLSRRKQRDAFIRLRQKIRSEAAVYGGEFTSHHVLDEPDRPPIFNQWADFYFLGSDGLTIWNATIVTAVLEFWDTCEGIANERAWEMLTPEEQFAEAEIKFEPIWHKGKRMYRMIPKPEIVYDKFHGLTYHDDKPLEPLGVMEPLGVRSCNPANHLIYYHHGSSSPHRIPRCHLPRYLPWECQAANIPQ